MKKSGIIRRLDELGRIVIPKEIRKTLHIKEGTPLDINVENGENIILRKFSPIKELGFNAQTCAQTLFETISEPIYIVDLDKLVTSCGTKINSDMFINENLTKLLTNRTFQKIENYNKSLFVDENNLHKNIAIAPIIVEGDILGAIIVDFKTLSEVSLSNIKLTANIIAKLVY